MNPVFNYFREIPLKDDNKFTLDFSDEEFVQKINFNLKKKKKKKLYCKFKLQFNFKRRD